MKNRAFNAVTLTIVSILIFAIVGVLLYTGVIDEYVGGLLCLSGINLVVALSLNLITGFTGQLALGQAGFMAVGSYTTAIAMMKFSIPMFPAVIVGGLVAAVFGIIIGFPTLRLRGDYLAITTLGFGIIIKVIINYFEGLTGGAAGLKGVPPFMDGDDFVLNLVMEYVWVFGFVLATIIIISNLIKSSPGRAIISIREDEIASNSMGINVAYYKMFAFTMSAFLAGIGGGLYAMHMQYLNPTMFDFMNSVFFVVYVVFGGLGSITGTVIATILLTYLQEILKIFGDMRLVVFGLMLIIMMLFWQKGIMGTKEFSIVGFVRKLMSGNLTIGKNEKVVK